MKIMLCVQLVVLTSISLWMSPSVRANPDPGELFVAGFIRDTSGQGVDDAIVVITDRHNKIYSTRSTLGGWFETARPLSADYVDRELRVTVIKSGFESASKTIHMNSQRNFVDVTLLAIDGYYNNQDYSSYSDQVLYGIAYDEQSGKPLRGALITVTEGEDRIPVSSAVSRDSGYFSIYYPAGSAYVGQELDYAVEHYEHDSLDGKLTLNGEQHLLEIGLVQNRYHFAFGPALQLQTTFDGADKETGGAILLNLSWYPRELVVVDDFFPRYQRSGFFSLDFSVGVVPYRKTLPGADEVHNINVYGIGTSYAAKGFLIPVRMGLSYSETDKLALYVGVNLPLYFF